MSDGLLSYAPLWVLAAGLVSALVAAGAEGHPPGASRETPARTAGAPPESRWGGAGDPWAAGVTEAAHEFYVATDGDDGWSGTLPAPHRAGTDGPFATLTRARDALRELQAAGGLQGPATVLIRGGTYYLSAPLSLGPQDSGTEQSPIIYRAYRDEQPVLSGGRVLSGWQPYRGEIVQCALPEAQAGAWRFRQLFFGGERQRRASWPNPDPQDPLYTGWAFVDDPRPPRPRCGGGPAPDAAEAGDQPPMVFSYEHEPQPPPRPWARPQQAEVMVFPWRCWVNDLIPLQAADPDRRLLTLARQVLPGWKHLMAGNRFRVENVLEELDQPGEWCLDAEAGLVYFWPPSGSVHDAEVVAPVTDRLVELIGTAEQPVRWVQFAGLTFTQTRSPFPEQVHPNFHAPTHRGEAVRLENAEYCRIAGNRFVHVGGDGVRLQDACAYNQIVGNYLAYAGGQGISLSASHTGGVAHTWREREALLQQSAQRPYAVGNLISNNHIHHTGALEKHGAGVHIWGLNSVDNVVSHNLIHHLPRMAITAQDGFGRVIMEYNDIHDVCLETADGGGIMINRWFPLPEDPRLAQGHLIRYNLIRDVIGCGAYGEPPGDVQPAGVRAQGRIWTPFYTWGIYFDNAGTGAIVRGNIVVGNTLGGISMPVSEPRDNLVENNVFAHSHQRQMDLGMSGQAQGNRFVRNLVYYTRPGAAALKTNNGHGVAECDYNVYYPALGAELIVEGVRGSSWARWRELGFDAHSVVADPRFVNPDAGDYRLRADSPAWALGFEPIPVERIGLLGQSAEE